MPTASLHQLVLFLWLATQFEVKCGGTSSIALSAGDSLGHLKSVVFLYKFRGFIPEINLTKEIEILSSGTVRMPKKEAKDDTRRWHKLPCLLVDRINIVKKNDLATKSD